MSIKGNLAIITDASTQASEAVAKRIERDGMVVIRNYPDGVPLEHCDENCCSFKTDKLAEVEAMQHWILNRNTKLSCLIHTDNVILCAKMEDVSENDFFECVNRNAKSAFLTTKVFAQQIAESGGGAVVYLSSVFGEKPTGAAMPYSVGKGAVKMLCREMSLFFGRKGVRCNLVEMDTTIETREKLDSKLIPFNYELEYKVPLGRITEPDDFAGTVSFLISDDAAQINGADILVDGGHLRWYLDRLPR